MSEYSVCVGPQTYVFALASLWTVTPSLPSTLSGQTEMFNLESQEEDNPKSILSFKWMSWQGPKWSWTSKEYLYPVLRNERSTKNVRDRDQFRWRCPNCANTRHISRSQGTSSCTEISVSSNKEPIVLLFYLISILSSKVTHENTYREYR
jgi:hypothetical protein